MASESTTSNHTNRAREKSRWRVRFKLIKKRLYERLPYIKRKTYRKLRDELDATRNLIFMAGEMQVMRARWETASTAIIGRAEEVCLFVTYAPGPKLKPHVQDYLNALLDEGVAVTLIINSSLTKYGIDLPSELMGRLNGCFVRENLGFDFAAWAHAFLLIQPESYCQRLYLINDSVVGPLDRKAFSFILAQVRNSTADCVALTEGRKPRYHLQSYFLAFNQSLVRSSELSNFMRGVLNLPAKQLVIDCYETRLTSFLLESGYRCEALFRNASPDIGTDDETIYRWRLLLTRGFPFVKASVVARYRKDPEMMRLLPHHYLDVEL